MAGGPPPGREFSSFTGDCAVAGYPRAGPRGGQKISG
jgi:hypothetical protein